MRKTSLVKLILCLLILFPVIVPSVNASSDTGLSVVITNAFPYSLHHVCVFADIFNMGENTFYNVSAVFSIVGGKNGEINETYSWTIPEMPIRTGWGFSNSAYGFGFVTITVMVSASNTETITQSIKGFQIGYSTLISFPILRNIFYSLMLRLYI